MFTLGWLVVEFIRISLTVDDIVASSDVDLVLTQKMQVLVIVFFYFAAFCLQTVPIMILGCLLAVIFCRLEFLEYWLDVNKSICNSMPFANFC